MITCKSRALSLSALALWILGVSHAETNDERIKQLEDQVEALAEALEPTDTEDSLLNQVFIGGYGELHYNNLDAETSDQDLEQIDFHRFVLYIGYSFTDRIRFYSELELEHALVNDTDTNDGSGETDPSDGEIELEQAFVQFDISEQSNILGGIFLIPVGILNETHEPPSFYGVERNDVENIIIPTTWWAGGTLFTHRFSHGLSVDIGVHEGLEIPTSGSNAFRVRSGRQKTSNAAASDLAGTTRLKYTGIAGLELTASLQYQSDPSQSSNDGLDDGLHFSGHIVYQHKMFQLRALYARWDFNGNAIEAAGVDEQDGWYLEPSFKPFSDTFLPYLANKIGFYFRYQDIEGARNRDRFTQWETGLNFWPHPDVVLKFDYRDRQHDLSSERGRDFSGFDLGLGYQF